MAPIKRYVPERLFYILIMFKDGSHLVYFTYSRDEQSALDLLLHSVEFDDSLVSSITITTPRFL